MGWQPARKRLARAFSPWIKARVRRRPTTAPPRANTHGAHQVVYTLAGITKHKYLG